MKSIEVYLFYRLDALEQSPLVQLKDPAFSAELWTPSLRAPWPHGASRDKKLHFLFRTLLRVTRMFPSNDSGALVLYEAARLALPVSRRPRPPGGGYLDRAVLSWQGIGETSLTAAGNPDEDAGAQLL